MSDKNAEAFNAFTANWIARVDSMNNSIIFLSGGIMSITIAAFLTTAPPPLGAESAAKIQLAWFLLAVSLACSVLLKFALVISGAITLKKMERNFAAKSAIAMVHDSPKWIHMLAWFLATISVFSCVVGFTLMSIGAGSLL